MLSKREFIAYVLGLRGAPPDPSAAVESPPGDFARCLLERCFGGATVRPIRELLIPRDHQYEPGAHYWPKTESRPFHVVLVRLKRPSSAILGGNTRRTVELHRHLQDGLDRATETPQASQSETLYVVALTDDHVAGVPRQWVGFGTRAMTTAAFEAFVLREEVLDWDPALAREHLDAFFTRHLEPLGRGARWQDAFITRKEHNKARELLEACCSLPALHELLDEIASSCGLPRIPGKGEHRLTLHPLPENHSIAADPTQARTKKNARNPFQGVRVFDADERLLGYILHVDGENSAAKLAVQLREHNHFHNLLVIYPAPSDVKLELWQGSQPLRGSLQFNGEGGVVQLLSRFFVVGPTEIDDAKRLAFELAWRARHLRTIALDELRKEKRQPADQRPLRDLLEIFNKAQTTLDDDQFADAYAQTVTYGLLVARWMSAERHDLPFTRKHVERLLPSTSPFLRDLFARLLDSNFDLNLIWLLDDITTLLARTTVSRIHFGNSDPSIHFYENFLDEYDRSIRVERGVYYTPDEVVSYIVRTTHTALQERFGLRLGLADTTSWREFAHTHDLAIPEGIDPSEPFVQILDPACGTGTFPLRVIEVIHETMTAEFARQNLAPAAARAAWTTYVREHLLPRLHGFELMMAPYIVTHLRLGLALQQTGFTFDRAARLDILLTDAMAEPDTTPSQTAPFTVILGNPPYAKLSKNRGAYAESLVQPYKDRVRGERNVQPLSDDYIKFLAFAVRALGSRPGCLCMITNRTMLDGLIHRGLRETLQAEFDAIDVVDLHGDTNVGEEVPAATANDNVFCITQGVAVTCMIRRPHRSPSPAEVHYAHTWGSRQDKLAWLHQAHRHRARLHPSPPLHLWVPSNTRGRDEYNSFYCLDAHVSVKGMGIKTRRDHFLVDFTREELAARFARLRDARDLELLRPSLGVEDNDQWTLQRIRDLVRRIGVDTGIHALNYRPFDRRYIWYHKQAIERGDARWPVMQHLIPDGLALLVARQTKGHTADAVFVVRGLSEMKTAEYSRGSYAIPVWLKSSSSPGRVPNFSPTLLKAWATSMALHALADADVDALLHYIYAVLHAASYRERYAEHLKRGYPRVPMPASKRLGDELCRLGAELVALHLVEDDYPYASWRGALSPITTGPAQLVGTASTVAPGYPRWREGRLFINASTSIAPVSESAWHTVIGGYPVLEKWLKARRGRDLGAGDLLHLRRVVNSLEAALGVQQSIDRAIEQAGGWPDAFRGETR